MPILATKSETFMHLNGEERYKSDDGHSARREDGLTPNGNPLCGRWVLRNASGDFVDFDQYRHDLFERNGLSS